MIHMTDQYLADAALRGEPSTHARILWNNLLAGADFAATGAREGFEAVRAKSPDTVSWWWPSVAGALTATLAGAAEIDGIGIAAHTIGSSGATLTVAGRVGGVWVDLHPAVSPEDDEPIMLAFPAVEVSAVRLTLSATARIGVIYAGPMLEMPQPGYMSLPPLALVRSTSFESNRSVTGQFMGRSITASSRPFQAGWLHLREAWVREVLHPFVLSARIAPFFVALRPAGYPTDCGYVLTSSDAQVERMGIQDLVSFTLTGEAHMEPEA